MPLHTALALRETQSATSRIWTMIIDSICYDDNCYSNNASNSELLKNTHTPSGPAFCEYGLIQAFKEPVYGEIITAVISWFICPDFFVFIYS